MQYREISYQDEQGILAYSTPYGLAMTNGDDEVIFTFS